MSMILLESAYKISQVKIKRRIIPVNPYLGRFDRELPAFSASSRMRLREGEVE
jgi:hypothetical protein